VSAATPARARAMIKHPRHKFVPRRNAVPAVPRAAREPATAAPAVALSPAQHLLWTAGGALGASAAGALAARYGLAPDLVAIAMAVGSGALALQNKRENWRTALSGAASAGGSQLMLLKLTPTPKPSTTVVVANQNQAPPAPRKNADMGALPAGMLDAAFERARAELSVSDHYDPHGHSYSHAA
jgi:hypothetical protein